MSEFTEVIKRDGSRPSEQFDRAKLHTSLKAACMSVRSPEGEAETTARKVCDAVLGWCEDRLEVTSLDLRRVAAHHLQKIHPDAAYMYKHWQTVL